MRGSCGQNYACRSLAPDVLRRKLDVAAINVANVGTAGFHAQHLSFQEYLKPKMGEEVVVEPERLLSLLDVACILLSELVAGAVRTTGNSYFVIHTAQGKQYTCDGSFSPDGTGRLVTMDGPPVLADSGAVTVPLQAG